MRGIFFFTPPRCEPLVGQIILERLDLVLDPLKGTITPRPVFFAITRLL